MEKNQRQSKYTLGLAERLGWPRAAQPASIPVFLWLYAVQKGQLSEYRPGPEKEARVPCM